MIAKIIELETAKLAKEKGFNLPVFYHYTENPVNDLISLVDPDNLQVGRGWVLSKYNDKNWTFLKYSAPLQCELQTWLREVHNIDIQVLRNKPGYDEYMCEIYKIPKGTTSSYTYFQIKEEGENYIKWSRKYEEALELGLQEALKLI